MPVFEHNQGISREKPLVAKAQEMLSAMAWTLLRSLCGRRMSQLWKLLVTLLSGVGVCLFQGGCLVTKRFSFEAEENVPASIESAPSATALGTSLGQIIEVELEETNISQSETPQERFPVVIRDPNLEQSLSWRVFLDFRAEFPRGALFGTEIPPSGVLERELEFSIKHTDLGGPGCHKVELLVSSQFRDQVPEREPELPGDIATAIWWVYTTDQTTTTVDFLECP